MFSANETAIVLMRRNIEDIITSQKRIGWDWEQLELARYDCTEGAVAEVKYRFWEEYQRDRIKHAFEIEYESLAEHPLWAAERWRRDFGPVQTVHLDMPGARRNARPCPCPDVLHWKGSEYDEAILVRTNEPAKILNTTGQLIWALCDGTHSLQDILQVLKAHFDNIEEDLLVHDLDEFIHGLVDGGFLRFSSRVGAADRRAMDEPMT
jgi:hypothetical protein